MTLLKVPSSSKRARRGRRVSRAGLRTDGWMNQCGSSKVASGSSEMMSSVAMPPPSPNSIGPGVVEVEFEAASVSYLGCK